MNECLDLEATGRPAEARELLRRAAESDPGVVQRFKEMRAILSDLPLTRRAPDLSREILREAHFQRPFLTRRRRRRVSGIRVALATGALATLTLMALMDRIVPGGIGLSPEPAPVSDVMEASRAEIADSVRSLAGAVDTLRDGITAPVSGVVTPGERRNPTRLSMGDTEVYAGPRDWTLRPPTLPGIGGPVRVASFDLPPTHAVTAEAPRLLGGAAPSATLVPQLIAGAEVVGGLGCRCGGLGCAGRTDWRRDIMSVPGSCVCSSVPGGAPCACCAGRGK